LVIENWSLANEFRRPNRSMAIDKFSMANSQLPSRMRFQSATSIMFDLRLVIRACFCAAPYLKVEAAQMMR
jgi:hypothetical protein